LQFQLQFIKKENAQSEQPEIQPELQRDSLYHLVLEALNEKILTSKEISETLEQKYISGQLRKVIRKLHKEGLIETLFPISQTIPSRNTIFQNVA